MAITRILIFAYKYFHEIIFLYTSVNQNRFEYNYYELFFTNVQL